MASIIDSAGRVKSQRKPQIIVVVFCSPLLNFQRTRKRLFEDENGLQSLAWRSANLVMIYEVHIILTIYIEDLVYNLE